MSCDGSSTKPWKEIWTEALKEGRCPFTGCDIRTSTCEHLDSYLDYGGRWVQPDIFSTGEIADFAEDEDETRNRAVGAWDFYKRLRGYPLSRDQKHLLTLKFHMKMSRREIIEHMGWTGNQFYDRRFKAAMKTISRRELGKKGKK